MYRSSSETISRGVRLAPGGIGYSSSKLRFRLV